MQHQKKAGHVRNFLVTSLTQVDSRQTLPSIARHHANCCLNRIVPCTQRAVQDTLYTSVQTTNCCSVPCATHGTQTSRPPDSKAQLSQQPRQESIGRSNLDVADAPCERLAGNCGRFPMWTASHRLTLLPRTRRTSTCYP